MNFRHLSNDQLLNELVVLAAKAGFASRGGPRPDLSPPTQPEQLLGGNDRKRYDGLKAELLRRLNGGR